MIKILLPLLAVLLTHAAAAKRLVFSDWIVRSSDPAVREIAELWSSYFAARGGRLEWEPEADLSPWWNAEEIAARQVDLLQGITSSGPESIHHTYSIAEIPDGFYEIRTQVELPPEAGELRPTICITYKLCAKRVDGRFRLFNYFCFSKRKLNRTQTRMIDFYYPHATGEVRPAIDRSVRFMERFVADFGLEEVASPPVIYLVGRDFYDTFLHVGLFVRGWPMQYDFAGVAPCESLILTARADHYHEIIHPFVMRRWPRAPMLLQEGVAIFFGGSTGRSFDQERMQLKRFAERYPETDWNDYGFFGPLNRYVPELGINPFLQLGGLLVERAFVRGGFPAVKALLEHTDMQSVFLQEFGVAPDRIGEFLRRLVDEHAESDVRRLSSFLDRTVLAG